MQYIYVTRAGYEKSREELKFLKTVKRKEIANALHYARSLGDLRENSEYDAAKNAQALNEIKISELEEKLNKAKILEEETNIPKDKVSIGSTVKLKDMNTQKEFQYTLVSEIEADYDQGKISTSSPIGQSLLGHKENEIVKIKIPAGTLIYKILKISR
ncbi:MAG: transcription elongation factor GreA [Candidatus Ratteibacteria bacterium]|nr:transcription elongation factor GreA [Candidatus Ratteibacteria bacterium]